MGDDPLIDANPSQDAPQETFMEDSVVTRVEAILAAELGPRFRPGTLRDDVSLDEGGLGLSSIEAMTIVVLIEEAFDIFFEDEEIPPSVESFGTLLRTIRDKLVQKPQPP